MDITSTPLTNLITTISSINPDNSESPMLYRYSVEYTARILKYIGVTTKEELGNACEWLPNDYFNKDDKPESDNPKSLDDEDERITKISRSTPLPMYDTPYRVDANEEQAFQELMDSSRISVTSKMKLINGMGYSIKYAYLCVKYISAYMERHNVNDSDGAKMREYSRPHIIRSAVNSLTKINFHNLKMARISDDPDQVKLYEDSINRNLIRTKGNRNNPKVAEYLDNYLPYWRHLPDYSAITGSLIYYLLNASGSNEHTYASVYYKLEGIIDNRLDLHNGLVDIKPLSFHFPIEGEDDAYTLDLGTDNYQPISIGSAPMADLHITKRIPGNRKAGIKPSVKYYNARVELTSGSDVDIPVFRKDKLDSVADMIYSHLQSPGISLEKKVKESGFHSWSITMSPIIPEGVDPEQYARKYITFKAVDIYYCSNKNRVLTHHVNMSRGYLTCADNKPLFTLDPSLIHSILNYGKISNIYYIGGKKSTSIDILARYYMRGCSPPKYIISEEALEELINSQYKRQLPYGPVAKDLE